jgi:hypothetical protein
MKQIKLELSVDQVNTILQALGNEPFVRVHELINTIQQQAQQQLQNGESVSAEKPQSTED